MEYRDGVLRWSPEMELGDGVRRCGTFIFHLAPKMNLEMYLKVLQSCDSYTVDVHE